MIKIFDTLEQYNTYTNNGQNLVSGFMYYVKEDDSTHYYTNNIDGVSTIYDSVETPSGNIEITENGEDIDIAQYATATVDVPIPEGYIIPTGNKEITENGTGIDVAQYATATVNVASSPTDLIDLIERDITSINIPSGTTTIGVNAFSGCTGLTSVTIPNTVTTFNTSAFAECSGLTSVTIPDRVTSIGISAFSSCTRLTSITIPNGVTSIGNYAFQGCSGLTSVTIGNSVTSIGINAFRNCGNMTSFTINATTPPTLGSNAFQNTNANLVIYVPSESVEAYKAASGWSSYASRIQAIPTT